jgi:Amt family ammonium transporter
LRLYARVRLGSSLALAAATLPLVTLAAGESAGQRAGVAVDTVWVVVAAVLVLFMQAGFAMLEVGFTRM